MRQHSLADTWDLDDIEQFSERRLAAVLTDADERRISDAHDRLLAASRNREVYGLSTGVGAKRFVAVARDRQSCLRLWQSHALQVGEPVADECVRALLVIRAIQVTRGGSGVSAPLTRALLDAAGGSELPVVRHGSSLGTGDIAALAAVALQLVRKGAAFEPSDGLPFMSSSALTFADAALTLQSLRRAIRAGTELTGMLARALGSNPEHFSRVALATQPPEVTATAERLAHIRGTGKTRRIQEPYSIRVAPHSLGSAEQAWRHAEAAVIRGINGSRENPMVLSNDDVAHVGNFYTIDLALAVDGVIQAMAHEASLAAARVSLLLDARFTGATDFLTDGAPDSTGAMMLEYAAASALNDIREAAGSHGAHGVHISHGAEEHAPFTGHVVRRLARVNAGYRLILACLAVALGRLDGATIDVNGLPDRSGDLVDRDLSADVLEALGLLDEMTVR